MKRVLSESFGCAALCFHRAQCSDELSVASHISWCDERRVFERGAYRCSVHDGSVRDVFEIGLFVSIPLTSRGRKVPAVASTLASLSGGREQITVEVVVVVVVVVAVKEREGKQFGRINRTKT
jgi:hypothetical protein